MATPRYLDWKLSHRELRDGKTGCLGHAHGGPGQHGVPRAGADAEPSLGAGLSLADNPS